jgi:hypothetical protein
MPEMTGTVVCVRVAEDSAFTTLQDASGTQEAFVLWFLPGIGIPASLNAFTRVLHSMWLSLLREAKSSGAPVTIVHPNGSAEVTSLGVG